MRKKVRGVLVWDYEVAECFNLFKNGRCVINGTLCAQYFEVLRYRQQLAPRETFTYSEEEIRVQSGLAPKRQRQAREILEGSGWIEVAKVRQGRGIALQYLVTALAREAIGHIRHPQDKALFMHNARKLAKAS